MNIRKSIIMALAGGSVAFAASGVALAAAPTLPFGGDGFSVDNGSFNPADLTTTPCPANSVCTNYEGGDGTDGLLQRQVVYTDPTSLVETSYIQAIVAETGVEEYTTGHFTDQTFANEQIVRMDATTGANNIAQKMIMHEDDPTVDGDEFSGTHVMLGTDYYDGPDLLYVLDQSVGMGGTAGAAQLTRIRGEITGSGGNLNGNGAVYKRVGIDQTGTGTPTGSMGDFIFRSNVRDSAAPQALILPQAGSIAGTGGTISTGTGVTALQALYIDGPNGLNPFDFQRFASNIGVDGDLGVANVIMTHNADPDEQPSPATGPWNWGTVTAPDYVSDIFGAVDDHTSSAIDLWAY